DHRLAVRREGYMAYHAVSVTYLPWLLPVLIGNFPDLGSSSAHAQQFTVRAQRHGPGSIHELERPFALRILARAHESHHSPFLLVFVGGHHLVVSECQHAHPPWVAL